MEIAEFYTGPLFVKTWVIPLDKQQFAIIDPGGCEDELIEYLKKSDAQHIEIMLTHGHFDHIGGISDLIKLYPSSNIHIHRDDSCYLGKQANATHLQCFNPINAERYIKTYLEKHTFPEPTKYFSDNQIVNGFKVLHTPGHTKGSVCFWKESEKVLFSGDTLFYHSHGRTDLFEGNETEIISSLKLILQLPDDTTVYPGHGSNTTIGQEKLFFNHL